MAFTSHLHPLASPKPLQSTLPKPPNSKNQIPKLCSKSLNLALSTSLAISLSIGGISPASAAKIGVNKPELLPKEYTTVIDVAGFLSDGQEKRVRQEIEDLEKDTGFKLRVLAQNYPDTPGLAIRDFWKVDDRTIVFVADPTFGNILNFNVGEQVDLDVPQSFWSRLAGKYGNMFYWKDKGEDASIEAAVNAIGVCLREPVSATNCAEIQTSMASSSSSPVPAEGTQIQCPSRRCSKTLTVLSANNKDNPNTYGRRFVTCDCNWRIVYLEPEYDPHHLRVMAKLLKEHADMELKLRIFHRWDKESALFHLGVLFPNEYGRGPPSPDSD